MVLALQKTCNFFFFKLLLLLFFWKTEISPETEDLGEKTEITFFGAYQIKFVVTITNFTI